MPREIGWAIVGKIGLYEGWWLTRREAIKAHIHDLHGCDKRWGPLNPEQRRKWDDRKRAGDRAVRIEINYD